MANELTVSCSLRYSKSGREVTKSYGGVAVTVSGTRAIVNQQTIGITEEAIVVGDIGTSGYLIAKNLDATNFVSIRPGTGTANLVKLKAGEVCMFRLALNGPWAIADTAPCDVEFTIISD
jgi:hypothetical protein